MRAPGSLSGRSPPRQSRAGGGELAGREVSSGASDSTGRRGGLVAATGVQPLASAAEQKGLLGYVTYTTRFRFGTCWSGSGEAMPVRLKKLVLKNFGDIKIGDVIEAFELVEKARD